ncbi:hypothetical protein MM239_15650 [Belliella sp. DSM 111904]|uniref:Uncharacterized protein n=1 Tax=Belliella filtrata TaxID=2923435 RepID=A0ABS9V355_9BACT|nr:hypothetical protein [Belliella filtrata]MCH7410842.1 hypothetical protein [Belliella filtrata]
MVRIDKTAIAIIIMIYCVACSKVDDIPADPISAQTNWVKSNSVDEAILNSSFSNGELNLIAVENYYKNIHLKSPANPKSFKGFISRPGWHKLPIHNQLFVSRTETDIYIAPSGDMSNESFIKLSPKDYDKNFIRFEDIPSWQGESFGLSGTGLILIPYRTAIAGIAENEPSFLLIETAENQNSVNVANVSLIKPNVIDYFDQVYQISSYDDFFIANIGGVIVQINSDKSINTVGSFNYFKSAVLEDEIVSFGIHLQSNSVTTFKSSKNGKNRTETNKLTLPSEFSDIEITTIDNKIIGFKNDRIYKIELAPNEMKITPLVNKNLEEGFITSITQANNTVVVTALCHVICGVYTKPLSDFFEVKN